MLSIDRRETDAAVRQPITTLPPISTLPHHLTTLPSGDVSFTGCGHAGPCEVGFEIKDISDVLQGIDTGRLMGGQIPRMMDDYGYPHLVVYGPWRATDSGPHARVEVLNSHGFWACHSPVTHYRLESTLYELSLTGTIVQRCEDKHGVARYIGDRYRWWAVDFDKHKGFEVVDRSSERAGLIPREAFSDAQRQVFDTALSFRGLGYRRALSATDAFGSVWEMVNATVEDWICKTKGKRAAIGPKTAKKVYDQIRMRTAV